MIWWERARKYWPEIVIAGTVIQVVWGSTLEQAAAHHSKVALGISTALLLIARWSQSPRTPPAKPEA